MDSKRIRNGMIYFLLVVALGAFLYIVLSRQGNNISATVSIAEIASLVRGGNVRELHVDGDEVIAYSGGKLIGSRKETGIGLIETLENLGVTEDQLSAVNVEIEAPSGWEVYGSILLALLPILLIAVFFIFILRQAQGAGNQAFSFSKSRARMFTGDQPTVNFSDVAGNEEARQDLEEVVEFLKEPQKFASLGARIPKGVLLVGPPGTGKTLMAKAVSGEAGVPFFNISGSEFVEMFVGVGASRVRDLFEQAKKNSRALSSSTRSTRSAATAVQGWAALTMNASKLSTRFWSRWTASTRTSISSSSPRPTGPISWTRRCCGPVVSTAQ